MACTPTSLLANLNNGFQNLPVPLLKGIVIRMLCGIRDGDAMTCTPQQLLADAKCIAQCIPDGLYEAAMISVLCQISAGGGVGGGNVTTGNGAPTSTPGSSAAIYLQQDSVPPGVIWEWYGGAWH